jgi:hypothetical protein
MIKCSPTYVNDIVKGILREQLRFDGYEVDMVTLEVEACIAVQAVANAGDKLVASHMET